jgi:putative oxidoreductase
MLRAIFPPFVGGRAAVALLLLRLLGGVAFVVHGWGKIQTPFSWMGAEAPVPGVLQGLAALSELGGGLAWIFGLLTPVGSLGILFTMTVAALFHISQGDPFIGQPSWELAGLYWAIALLLIAIGPGTLSIDAQVFGAAHERRG